MGLLDWWRGRTITPRDGAFWSGFFGGSSYAGKPVTPDTALQVSTVWACIRLLSETIGTLPIGVFQKDDDGGRTALSDHPLYGVLHDAPNADQTAAEFWEGVVAYLCTWGNAYAETTWSTRRLTAMTLLRPDLMKVDRDEYGALRYTYSDPKGRRVYTQEEIFHVRGFGTGLDVGMSPIGYARHTIGAAMAADEFTSKLFAGGLHTPGLLTTDGKVSPEQRVQLQKIMQEYMGSANAQKLMILEAGLKFSAVAMNPEDAQLLATRAFQVEEICRWFRVPPWMVGSTEKSTSWGTGLEQQMIAFLTFSLAPYLKRIEGAVKRQLLSAVERRTIYPEFNLEGLLRADSAARAALYSTLAQNGVYTRNEIRGRENLSRQPGGDMLTVQSNLLPLDMLGQAPSSSDQQLRSAIDAIVGERVSALIGPNGGQRLEDA